MLDDFWREKILLLRFLLVKILRRILYSSKIFNQIETMLIFVVLVVFKINIQHPILCFITLFRHFLIKEKIIFMYHQLSSKFVVHFHFRLSTLLQIHTFAHLYSLQYWCLLYIDQRVQILCELSFSFLLMEYFSDFHLFLFYVENL